MQYFKLLLVSCLTLASVMLSVNGGRDDFSKQLLDAIQSVLQPTLIAAKQFAYPITMLALRILSPAIFTRPFGKMLIQYGHYLKDPRVLKPHEPECNMNTPEIIESLGYEVETHRVKTKDGYILELHRIPCGRGDNSSATAEPVLLIHGFIASSADWVINAPEQSLGFVLADKGYDVWLGNFRGNTYSTNHVALKTTEKDFWDFCIDELAEHDLPAMIDYILETTSRDELACVGHSMGAATVLALLSSDDDHMNYNSKIKQFVALGPATSLTNTTFLTLKILAPIIDMLVLILDVVGEHSFAKNDAFFKYFALSFCLEPRIDKLCMDFSEITIGVEGFQLNKTRMPIYFSHMPAGSSVQVLRHYIQNYLGNTFKRYDYGLAENVERYGQESPPHYDLSRVSVPTAVLYGERDQLSRPEAVLEIIKQLNQSVVTYSLEVKEYSHMDLLWSTSPDLTVIHEVVRLLAD